MPLLKTKLARNKKKKKKKAFSFPKGGYNGHALLINITVSLIDERFFFGLGIFPTSNHTVEENINYQ